MKIFQVEFKRPSTARLVATMVGTLALVGVTMLNLGLTRLGWMASASIVGAALGYGLGVESTRGWREMAVATLLATAFALAAMVLHDMYAVSVTVNG